MEDVLNWLKTPHDYLAGIRILMQYCRDANLRALFREDETPYKRNRLVRAMQELIREKQTDKSFEENAHNKFLIEPPLKANLSGWPNPITDQEIMALHEQWKPIFANLMALQHQVYEIALQGEQGNSLKRLEASQMAHQILDLDDQVHAIYRRRDFYLKNGHFPETATDEEVVGDPVRWATNLANSERYVRQYRNKIEKAPNHKLVPRWTALLVKYTKKVNNYRKLLKLDE